MHPQHIVVIGSSAGGPRILRELFTGMPRLDSAVVLIQHMPEFVNEPLTKSLNSVTEMDVRVAKDGDELERGIVYVAPTGLHLILEHNTTIRLSEGEKVNFVCPSVDVTMQSLRSESGMNLTGVILTGMGKDGAAGTSHIKRLGGMTIAQDEETSIIYGMPLEAKETGDVDYVLPPQKILKTLVEHVGVMV